MRQSSVPIFTDLLVVKLMTHSVRHHHEEPARNACFPAEFCLMLEARSAASDQVRRLEAAVQQFRSNWWFLLAELAQVRFR